MAMNIKSPEAHELAKRLAALEGITVTEAVTISLREALDHRARPDASVQRQDRLSALAARMQQQYRKLPHGSLQQAIDALYDGRGLPQ